MHHKKLFTPWRIIAMFFPASRNAEFLPASSTFLVRLILVTLLAIDCCSASNLVDTPMHRAFWRSFRSRRWALWLAKGSFAIPR